MKKSVNVTITTKRHTLTLTYTAVLVAIAVIANIFDIPVSGGTIKLSLSYIPCFVAGMFLGPMAGLLTGLLGDVIGLMINPQGPWIPLITLSSALLGFIPGLVFKLKRIPEPIKLAISLMLCFFVCTMGFNTMGIYFMYIAGKKGFWVYWTGRIATQSIVVAVNAGILFLIYYPLKRLIFKSFDIIEATVDYQAPPPYVEINTELAIDHNDILTLDHDEIINAEIVENEQDNDNVLAIENSIVVENNIPTNDTEITIATSESNN